MEGKKSIKILSKEISTILNKMNEERVDPMGLPHIIFIKENILGCKKDGFIEEAFKPIESVPSEEKNYWISCLAWYLKDWPKSYYKTRHALLHTDHVRDVPDQEILYDISHSRAINNFFNFKADTLIISVDKDLAEKVAIAVKERMDNSKFLERASKRKVRPVKVYQIIVDDSYDIESAKPTGLCQPIVG